MSLSEFLSDNLKDSVAIIDGGTLYYDNDFLEEFVGLGGDEDNLNDCVDESIYFDGEEEHINYSEVIKRYVGELVDES